MGLYCEWYVQDGTSSITRVLQISLRNEKVIVGNLSVMGSFTRETFHSNVKLLLENDRLRFVGRKIKGDDNRIQKLGANIKKTALKHDSSVSLKGKTSLPMFYNIYINLDILKTYQLSDYNSANLSLDTTERI